MKSLKNKKLISAGVLTIIMIIAAGILAFGGFTITAYAHVDESVHDGYAMEDVQELIGESNTLGLGTRDLQAYSQNGTMNIIEVGEEEEEL